MQSHKTKCVPSPLGLNLPVALKIYSVWFWCHCHKRWCWWRKGGEVSFCSVSESSTGCRLMGSSPQAQPVLQINWTQPKGTSLSWSQESCGKFTWEELRAVFFAIRNLKINKVYFCPSLLQHEPSDRKVTVSPLFLGKCTGLSVLSCWKIISSSAFL